MKRVISLAIILIMAFSLAACKVGVSPVLPGQEETETNAPEATPVPEPEETPEPSQTTEETPEPGEFVPEGYNAHDYLALKKLFSTELGYDTLGEQCFYDRVFTVDGEAYSILDPSTWNYMGYGVVWDEDGYAVEITFHPMASRIPAELELTGFERLKKFAVWYLTFDKVTVKDCPMLTDGCMIYTANAEGEAYVEAGFADQLNVGSRTHVYCSLMGEEHPFTLDLTAEGPGSVKASCVLYDGVYRVTATAIEDEYNEFLGWFDEDGNFITDEKHYELQGETVQEPISGDHRYTAKFAAPDTPDPQTEGDYFCEIKPFVPSHIDIDCDGKPDTVLLSTTDFEDYAEDNINVTITLASKPDEPYYLPAGTQGWAFTAAAVDFDPNDGHVEVVLSYDMEDGDPVTYVFRMKDDGSGFDTFVECIEVAVDNDGWMGSWYSNGLPEDYVFSAEHGLDFLRRTEILGTHFVLNRFTVDEDGIKIIDEEYTYHYEVVLKLKRDLTVTLENGKTRTVKKGEMIKAYSTDRKTFVKIELPDGRIGRVEVTFGNDDYDFPVLLNGIEQDKYADMPYAD